MTEKRRLGFAVSAVLAAILLFIIFSDGDRQPQDVAQESAPVTAEPAPAPVANAPAPSETVASGAQSIEATAGDGAEVDAEVEASAPVEAETVDELVDASAETDSEDEAPPPAAIPDEKEPVLDVVRVEPDGSGLVAGRAQPNAEVEIVVGGLARSTVQAGPDGAFVALIETEPSAKPQEIVARTKIAEEQPQIQSAPVFIIASESQESPVVIAPSDEGVSLLQPPTKDAAKGVTLDTISYDPQGQVRFAGRTSAGSAVRLYLDNEPVAEANVSDDGSWQAVGTSEIAPGVYDLRVDQIGPEGSVLARISTPFLREAIGDVQLAEGSLTVQKGDSLWRIAERRYGAGIRYTVIVGANAESIRNPDLIYPGQIFTLPD